MSQTGLAEPLKLKHVSTYSSSFLSISPWSDRMLNLQAAEVSGIDGWPLLAPKTPSSQRHWDLAAGQRGTEDQGSVKQRNQWDTDSNVCETQSGATSSFRVGVQLLWWQSHRRLSDSLLWSETLSLVMLNKRIKMDVCNCNRSSLWLLQTKMIIISLYCIKWVAEKVKKILKCQMALNVDELTLLKLRNAGKV